MELTNREQIILRSVIHSFIINAKPVGSTTVSKQNLLNLSPASIRNTMADLESLGLLEQPHTSAGRIPTDLGYRVFVDSLMEKSILSSRIKEYIDENLSESSSSLEEVLSRSSALLGRLSSLLGVVLSPKFEEGILQRIDLTRLSEDRLLVIIAIKSGLAKTKVLELNFKVEEEHLTETTALLNQRLSGLNLRQIREEIGYRVREAASESNKDLLTLFVDNADQVFYFKDKEDLYQTGLKALLKQPEFEDSEKLRSVIELLEDRTVFVHLLKGAQSGEGVKITIGSENFVRESKDLTMISTAFKIGKNTGTISIMGPTRMEYSRIYSLVDYTAHSIEKCVDIS